MDKLPIPAWLIKEDFRMPWRPAHEMWAVVGWIASFVGMVMVAIANPALRSAMFWTMLISLGFLFVAVRDTLSLWMFKVSLGGRPFSFISATKVTALMKAKPETLWLGRGFNWLPRHTQRCVEIRKMDIEDHLPPDWFLEFVDAPRGLGFVGAPWLHGVEPVEGDVYIPLNALEGHTIVWGTTGAGKAQPLDARVHTPSGWATMGDMRVGQPVSTPDGGSATVTGVFPQGRIPIYRITFVDGRQVEACGEHLWEIHHKHWQGKYKPGVSRAGKAKPRILTTLELKAQIESNRGTFSVRLPSPVQKPEATLPIDPYVLGCILGDGLIGKGMRLTFCNAALDVIDRIRSRLPEELSLAHVGPRPIDYVFRFSEGHARVGRMPGGAYTTHPYKTALRDLGLGECRAWEKFVPSQYKEASVDQRLEVLRGLMDTDGEVGKNRCVYFTSTSERLAKDVQELVWSLGGIAKISPKQTFFTGTDGKRKTGRPSYLVSIRHPRADWLLTHEKRLSRLDGEYQYADRLRLAVQSIEYVRDAEAQCISIDHPDHLYITDGYVVTHNTRLFEVMIYQAVMRGDVVCVIDPKGDSDLRKVVESACKAAGRSDAFLFFHPAFPNESIRIDPLANWSRVTAVASRISALLPSGGSSDSFVQFAWNAVNKVATALVYVGIRPNIANLRTYVEGGAAGLAEKVLRTFLATRVEGWEARISPYIQKARDGKAGIKIAGASRELLAYAEFYQSEIAGNEREDAVDGLLAMVSHDQAHYGKMIQTVLPLLTALTTGDLGKLLSPDATDINDQRPIYDSDKILRQDKVLYLGLDSLSDVTVSAAIGAITLADLAAVAGDIYNYGGDGPKRRVQVFVDEASEAVSNPVIQLLNKGRGAGFVLTLAAQTYPDFISKLGSREKADMVLGNCNNMIALRTKDTSTQRWISDQFGKTHVQGISQGFSMGSESNPLGMEYSAGVGTRIVETETDMFPPELLGMLPNLHYVALVAGGRLIKGRLSKITND